MKKCPFCAELIQEEAIKCRHCSEFLDGTPLEDRKVAQRVLEREGKEHPKDKVKWFHAPLGMFFSMCCMGPFAIPLVWTHPRYSKNKKILYTIILGVITIFIIMIAYYFICKIIEYYQQVLTI